MNTTPYQKNSQGQLSHLPMTPSRAKAGLGQSTLLRTFLLPPKQAQNQPQAPQEQPQTPSQPTVQETMQQGTQTMQNGLKELETKFMGELEQIKSMMKPKDKNEELEELKKQINDVLNDNGEASKT